jgi:hypothetical protein
VTAPFSGHLALVDDYEMELTEAEAQALLTYATSHE